MWIKRSEYRNLKEIEEVFDSENKLHVETSRKLAEYEHPEKYKPGDIVFNHLIKSSSLDAGINGWYRWYRILNLVNGEYKSLSENCLDDLLICEQNTDKNCYFKKD